jgi:Kef-type K+ transport system membrane component KefB
VNRVLVLGILLAAMVGLRSVTDAGTGAHDPLIVAAIGFVVLASYTAAEIGFLLSLPRVSGFIAVGVLLGPSAGNILTSRVVEDMTMFNTLALGLIATGAGLELDLTALRSLLRTLLATVGAKIVFTGGLVFAGFTATELLLHPMGLPTPAATVAIGLVLAVLSLGTSPAITLALISETGARGRLADLTLGAAVVKDLVLVVLLAIALTAANGMLGHSGARGDITLLLAKELGGSVLLGGLLGALIIAYVRFVGAEMLLFVAGLVLAAAELSKALHLDLLLVFFAAGFSVRNECSNW